MKVDYTTKFSDKRKTLGLMVERDKSVVVLAPAGTKTETIERFISKKRFWLYQKINHSPKFTERPRETPFVSGKAIPYLGRNYKLDVVRTPVEGIQFSKGEFLVSKDQTPQGMDHLATWYKEKAKEKIPPKVERFARQLGVEYNDILISDLQYRWGSCTLKGNLNFNWRLIKTPHFVINYVVIHELAHLLELNHSPRFWNIVQVQMPNYQEAKDWLKEFGEGVF